jgi:hypothetical protein
MPSREKGVGDEISGSHREMGFVAVGISHLLEEGED